MYFKLPVVLQKILRKLKLCKVPPTPWKLFLSCNKAIFHILQGQGEEKRDIFPQV